MKNSILIFVLFFPIFNQSQDLTYVPDDNFEQRLIDLFFDDVTNNNWTNILDQNYFSEDCGDLCNEDFCEGVSIELESFNELNIQVLISTENNPNFWCSYCGLTLEDGDGNIVAIENPWTASVFYGLAGGNIELRNLDIIQSITFPFEGFLNAVNGLMPNVNVDENFIIDPDNPVDMDDGDVPFTMCSWPLQLNNISGAKESLYKNRNLIKTVDILGRENRNKGFQLHIYDDGFIQKKYRLK